MIGMASYFRRNNVGVSHGWRVSLDDAQLSALVVDDGCDAIVE